MNRICSFMILNGIVLQACCTGCYGQSVLGIGFTEGPGDRAWTPSRSEPFVCTLVNTNKKQFTNEPSIIAVPVSSAFESTTEETFTSQESSTGAKKFWSTLHTTSYNNFNPTTRMTLQRTPYPTTENTTTEHFEETTLQTSVRSASEKEKHSTLEMSTQGVTTSQSSMHTTVENDARSTSQMVPSLSIKETEKTTTDSFDETTITISTDRQAGSTSHIMSDPTTEQIQETTTAELRQTTLETTTVALQTTTDRQAISTSHIMSDPTTEQIQETTTAELRQTTVQTTTVGRTTIAAADRECQHSRSPYCYELIYEKKTYAEAYKSCLRLGAGSYLVSMLDSDEANDVKLLIVEQSSEPTEDYWMGLGRTRYSWEDGKTLLYNNFAADYVSGMCTVMDSISYKWKSRQCSSFEKTVCESEKGSQSCSSEFEGSCYNLFASTSTLSSAKTTCGDSGAHVLQVETKAEQDFIQSQLSIGEDIWIGLKSDGGNGFKWADGASLGYDYFGSDYESNFGVCFRIDYNDGFHWNDERCDALRNFICKWSL